MGESYSLFKQDLEAANKLCNDSLFETLTGLNISFKLKGRFHFFHPAKNKIKLTIKSKNLTGSLTRLINQSTFKTILQLSQEIFSLSLIRKKTVSEDNLCCICLENRIDTFLGCGHGFCAKDIEDWGARDNHCPMCRRTIKCEQMFLALDEFKGDPELNTTFEELLKIIRL